MWLQSHFCEDVFDSLRTNLRKLLLDRNDQPAGHVKTGGTHSERSLEIAGWSMGFPRKQIDGPSRVIKRDKKIDEGFVRCPRECRKTPEGLVDPCCQGRAIRSAINQETHVIITQGEHLYLLFTHNVLLMHAKCVVVFDHLKMPYHRQAFASTGLHMEVFRRGRSALRAVVQHDVLS